MEDLKKDYLIVAIIICMNNNKYGIYIAQKTLNKQLTITLELIDWKINIQYNRVTQGTLNTYIDN